MTKLRDHSTEPFAAAFLGTSLIVVAVFAVLLLRIFYIQIWMGEDFQDRSENNRIRLLEIHAPRGKVLDTHHENLVDNRPCFDVTAIPEEIQDYAALEKTLAELSPLPMDLLHERLEKLKKAVPFRAYTIWEDATWDTMAFLEANRLRIPGVVLQVNQARDYLFGDLLAHVIGYTGEINRKELEERRKKGYRIGDRIGKVGIERNWEEHLRGIKGGVQVEVDAMGRQISILREKAPIPGKNVVLCLDRRLQQAARNAFGEETGVALAADPRDGRILCYVNLPTFEPNIFVGGVPLKEWRALMSDPLHPLTNRAIQGLYPPGSVFKIAVALTALEEGLATTEERLFCSGKYRLGGRSFRCWKKQGHGWVDLHQSLVESCDVYYYQIGQRLGIKKIKSYAEKFGLGKKSRIRLQGEQAGLVPSPDWKRRRFKAPWYQGETLLVSIGQGALLTTPMQLLMMVSTVCNGGHLWKPRLVDRVEHSDGRLYQENPSERRGEINLSPETFEVIRKALRAVVHSKKGTGRKAQILYADVAGKTGTAQVVRQDDLTVDPEDIPREQRDHAWFACYAPAASAEIAVVVLVEHGGHGGDAAAPIAKQILETYFQLKESPSSSS